MERVSRHIEWLSLIEVSGPFLAVSMLERAFPQGLESVETPRRRRLRAAYEEWSEAVDNKDNDLRALHREWVRLVLKDVLEYDDDVLIPNSELDQPLSVRSMDTCSQFAPDLVVSLGNNAKPRLFVSILDPETDMESVRQNDGWPVSPIERMVLLCRESEVQLGLITNGERWTLVNAIEGATSGYASWYSRLWIQEPITLQAFQSLLGVRRCFGPEDETLEALLQESLQHQDEVTDTLGAQVRRAVEVLVQCLDKADEDRDRKLLQDVEPSELYEAGLTVMMRLVFILCAEERGLLLLGDPVYDQYYALSTLRAQLEEERDLHGQEVLERRYDAWARVLTVFRTIYSGIEHESLRMPALGGSLFDPDRFPFLEGRQKGTSWIETEAMPLPIDNRTVLLLLNSLQVLEQSQGAVMLSYRALDVEQIGHVYEGLLEHTAKRVPQITLGLTGSQNAKDPNIPLHELESAFLDSAETLIACVKETTKRSESAIRHAIERTPEEEAIVRLLSVCGGDTKLAERILPYVNLLRTDAWDEPIIYRENSFMVTLGADRRDTGTHYTPKSLTESIVALTLEPLVYVGPEEGKPRELWQLKLSSQILDLKICDPAMGSGAFLVQACRWIAERLIEAWAVEEQNGKVITVDGLVQESLEDAEPMPSQLDERLIIARQLVAERCLYGVDVNPLAVELAKLSIWLITMAKNRPFAFLDHNLRNGDSLVGIHRLDQLTKLVLRPEAEERLLGLFGRNIVQVVGEAAEIREKLRNIPIRDIHDVETMKHLDKTATNKLEGIECLADALIGEYLRVNGSARELELALQDLAYYAEELFDGNGEIIITASKRIRDALGGSIPGSTITRKPFHWPLEYPEVFMSKNGGFDAIIGNPPFMGGRRMRSALGDTMMQWFVTLWPHSSLNADLCSFFYLRASMILRENGEFGLLSTNTIAQGDTARTGLAYLVDKSGTSIRFALSSFPWPGSAAVTASLVIGHQGDWSGLKHLDQHPVEFISPALDDKEGWGEAKKLLGNKQHCYQGSVLRGTGFILTQDEAKAYMSNAVENKQVIHPYLNGESVNSDPQQKADRWAIDFRNASLEECESRWPELLQRVRLLVKPERDKGRTEADRKYWWRHWRTREELYDKLKNKENVFVISGVTKYVAIVRVPAKQVFSHAVFVFDLPSWAAFATLQCSFHELWVRRQSSSMKGDIRYAPSDCFDTYPFLHLSGEGLEEVGLSYHDTRKKIMLSRSEGLTSTYNRFHDPNEAADDIAELRNLHMVMDYAVANAYGWGDIQLEHGFYDTKQGLRYTISESAAREVLIRLLKLNHDRFELETPVGAGNKKVNPGNQKIRRSKRDNQDEKQLGLFI